MIAYNNNRIMKRHFTNNLRMFDVTLRDGLQSTKAIMSLKQKRVWQISYIILIDQVQWK